MAKIFRSPVVAIILMLALAGAAQAQCAGGLISNCPPAVSPQLTDIIPVWQFGQNPHQRKIALSDVLTIGLTGTFASPPPMGNVAPNTGAFTTLSASGTVSGAGVTALMASPGPIGSTSPSTGSFTSLAASGAVSGAGITARFASPGPIGSTAPGTGAFTTLSASSTVSGAGFTSLLAPYATLASPTFTGTVTTPAIGNGASAFKISGSGQWTANGAVATTMTSLGPTGSHTTVQEWLTFTDSAGVVRYIPAY